MDDFGGGEDVNITVYDLDGITVLGSFAHNAGDDGSIIDLSAFSGVGSMQIEHTGGGDSMLRFVDYDPSPASGFTVTPAGGTNGSNLNWTFGYETDLDGNGIIQATVTDSNDGSEFIMRSNGFYQHTPDQSGVPAPITESFQDLSADNGITLTSPDATPTFNATYGIGMNSSFDSYSSTVDTGEEITINFDSVQHPFGVKEVSLTNYWASGNATISVFDTGGLLLESYATAINGAMDIALQSTGIGSIRIETDTSSSDYISIQSVDFTPLQDPALLSTGQAPILVDYVLTDTDGQSDSAQLALYTIDQTITGTSGIDNIAGGSLNDAIIGDDGDDILSGNAGNDSLSGGAGDDTLSGSIGDDYLSGGDGQDSLSGGAGSDTLDGGAGDDVVDGSSGDDVVLGGEGDDLVFGGSGDDRLEGGAGDDVLSGGSGNDVIFGDAGDDRINGGSGNDSLVGGDGIDIFALNSGDEGTVGTPAVDTIADFTLGVGGDVLDLSDMLQGEEAAPLDGFLNFSYNGVSGDTTISIDADGSSGTAQQIVLSGVDLTANGTLTDSQILDNLLNNGNLIVDQ
jgi:Ca2+-binding RTX toxin-like protein